MLSLPLTRALGAVEGVASVRFRGHVAEVRLEDGATSGTGGASTPCEPQRPGAERRGGSLGELAPPELPGRIVAAVRAEGYETRPEWISPTRPWRGAAAALALAAALVAGSSSGAALAAALRAIRAGLRGNVVVLFPDRGDRYFSKGLFPAD